MQHLRDYILIIGFFFLGVFAYESCHKTDKKVDFSDMRNYNKIKEVHDTVYKYRTTTFYKKGTDIPYVVVSTDTVQNYVHDTVLVISDYNRIYAYSDTINVDSNTFVINDTISQNKIQSRGFEAKITEKTILTTTIKTAKAKNSLYLGFRGDLSGSNGLEVLSPGIVLNAKNKVLIGLNVDLGLNRQVRYGLGVYFKIGNK